MLDRNKEKLTLVFLYSLSVLLVSAVIYHLSSLVNEAEANYASKHKDDAIVDLG